MSLKTRNDTNGPYWSALAAGAGVGLIAAVTIYVFRDSLATWRLDGKQGALWDIVLKSISGYIAVIGAVITAFKYIDDKSRQRDQDHRAAILQIEQDDRNKRKDFLQQRQAIYSRLGQALATIMNYDPNDAQWNPAKEKFYEIYWGELPFVADEAVMKKVEPFSDDLYGTSTKEEKERLHLSEKVQAITAACRKSLGDAWDDINANTAKAE
jgi:hypothetical protein